MPLSHHLVYFDILFLSAISKIFNTVDSLWSRWYYEVVGDSRCPIVDTWWQTETGGFMVSPA